jgi:hypothetical protein
MNVVFLSTPQSLHKMNVVFLSTPQSLHKMNVWCVDGQQIFNNTHIR